MVENTIKSIAYVLKDELDWFFTVLDTRIKLHFGQECDYSDVFEVIPHELDEHESIYGNFINHYDLNFPERIVFILGLIPHIKPQMLDVLFAKNATNSRDFTEFGGHQNEHYKGFLPTGETALFILAGDDIEKRIGFQYVFAADHFFTLHNILHLAKTNELEPRLSGVITIAPDIIDFVTTGKVRKPVFSTDFPAKRVETGLHWEELILDSYTMDQVLEIKAWIEYGDELLEHYDLKRKIKPGFRSLFYGPSGTGKTLTACLLGKETDKEVYRIDLSTVISKYIGETEKNLEKIFNKAGYKDWILFFDEADALFGKRTKITNAHDRFANQEISYLLQRVEDYAGVVILATNLRSNLDDAFIRRFQSIIHFPMPKQSERLKLWQNSFSDKLQLHKDVDLNEIAAEYELSGGAIINVVRYATLMMLKNHMQCIEKSLLIDGLKKEFQKEGRIN